MARPGAPGIVVGSAARPWSVAALIGIAAACAQQMEPAERALGGIHAVMASTAVDAGRYLPDEVVRVQHELDDLDLKFGQHEYAAVLAGAPRVMTDAQSLATAAAAGKRKATQAMEAEWATQAAALPEALAALETRLDSRGKRLRPAHGIDLAAARTELRGDESLWSKAQAAFATGNLSEALTISHGLSMALANLAAKLR